jgi:hypothetical protein
MDDRRMSWSGDKVYDRMPYTAEPSWGATSPADAELPGMAWLDGWLVDLFNNISRSLLLNVGT